MIFKFYKASSQTNSKAQANGDMKDYKFAISKGIFEHNFKEHGIVPQKDDFFLSDAGVECSVVYRSFGKSSVDIFWE